MTRPDPTVTVPVEPTEAMLDAWHKATWPQGPRVSPLSQQGLSFARAYRAMLAAAPAAPQAAGVGEDLSRAVACVDQVAKGAQVPEVYGGEWCLDPAIEFRAHLTAILSALRAPSREPEGGAVTRAMEGLRFVAKMESSNDRMASVMVANWIIQDIATREEAPACEMCNGRGEVGGPTGQTPESFDYVTELCPDCGGTGKVEAPEEAGERIVGTIAHVSNGRAELPELIASALRAQPQAREVRRTMTLNLSDAEMTALEELIATKDLDGPKIFRNSFKLYQAVALGAASVTWTESGPLGLPAPDQPPAREDAQPVHAFAERVFKAGHADGWSGNQTRRAAAHADAQEGWERYVRNGALSKSLDATKYHPAPDALRVAVEALRAGEGDSVTILCDDPEADRAEDTMAVERRGSWTDWKDRRFYGRNVDDALSQALAALQAEQGAK